ncbi:MAG: hypothetical protein BWX70_02978 [Verrucomicrobia bacterium ADurb.Bin070]|nr:MAG: hypothetical protein BWX70_02978 [Verrucomicrobia bacterium ADurb.Bin070]
MVFVSRRSGARAVPGIDRRLGIDPPHINAVAVAGDVEHAGLAGQCGTPRGHLAAVVVPVVAVHPNGRRHAFGCGVDPGGTDRAHHMRGVVVCRAGTVLRGHAPGELLMGRAGRTGIPHPHRPAVAGHAVGRGPQQVRPGRDRCVGIAGGAVERPLAVKVDQLKSAAAGFLALDRQAPLRRARPGRLAPHTRNLGPLIHPVLTHCGIAQHRRHIVRYACSALRANDKRPCRHRHHNDPNAVFHTFASSLDSRTQRLNIAPA